MSMVASRCPRLLLALAVAVTVVFVAVAPQPANAARTKAKSKVTLSGDVTGRASGGKVMCTDSTGPTGPLLGLTLDSFTVRGKRYTTSVVLAGTSWVPFVRLAADGSGAGWASGPSGGTLELTKDKMSGRFGAQLTSSDGIGAVKIKGSFTCDELVKTAATPAPAA